VVVVENDVDVAGLAAQAADGRHHVLLDS